MFNALLKKRKGNKGFTLIELIVVIAIIAILALLLVPRFMGFTDSAKVKADVATARTIQTAVTSLIGDGTIKGVGSFTMPNNNGTFVISGLTAPTDAGALKTAVQNLTGSKYEAQATTGAGFNVVITSSDVTVAPY